MKPTNLSRTRASQQKKEKCQNAVSRYESAILLWNPVSRSRLWKSGIKRLLKESIHLNPGKSKAHALLAYVHGETNNFPAAETSIRRALRIDPDNGVYLRLLLAFLLAQKKDALASRWLRKLAILEDEDLSKLKVELRKANFPTDIHTLVLNAFPNAIGWFESFLWDEIERIQHKGRSKSFIDAEIAAEIKRYQPEKIDARKVPHDLRCIIPMAMDWGIGDDATRAAFVERATKARKRQLRRSLSAKVRGRIHEWLDRFSDGATMTDEAAAFMYMLLAYEEATAF